MTPLPSLQAPAALAAGGGASGWTLSLSITVVGWVVAWFFAVRAQRTNLRNQILDAARRDITAAFREYQRWLGEVQSIIFDIKTAALITADGKLDHVPWWRRVMERFAKLREGEAWVRWATILEEYQVLFPETVHVRQELLRRSMAEGDFTTRLHGLIPPFLFARPGRVELDEAVRTAEEGLGPLRNQSSLIEDLKYHLQNAALGKIFRRRVPDRRPPDPNCEMLVQIGTQLEIRQARDVDYANSRAFARAPLLERSRAGVTRWIADLRR
jgi:hypothetical protein